MAINPKQNYKRVQNEHVFTGRQINNLLNLSGPQMQAVILMSIELTDEPATEPNSRYGPVGEQPPAPAEEA